MRICILDILGLKYTGTTLETRGLGGSESAVILMSKELVKLGFSVTVFNQCEAEGIFDGVEYKDLSRIPQQTDKFDILICSRSCLPYAPQHIWEEIQQKFNLDISYYQPLIQNSYYKVMWMHDTFAQGDIYLESLLLDKCFHEIFTLSDWHSSYISTTPYHSTMPRSYAVLKDYIFQTRNGLMSLDNDVDIQKKDKDLFVYNSSVSKGMEPLLLKVWPEVRKEIPSAKLVIIGGYYRGANQGKPDIQEEKFWNFYDKFNNQNGITFTKIIKQQEIAEILKKASFLLYPAAFPETFGISTTEAINYNVLPITCDFGALEEIADDSVSYKIPYPFDWNEYQIHRFLDIVKKAYFDDYLRESKQYACNAFKGWLGWDVIAKQWRQHFFRVLGEYLLPEQTLEVREINSKLLSLYNRRHINPEDKLTDYSKWTQKSISVVITSYNSEQYVSKCLTSIAAQLYDNYQVFFYDDASTDKTLEMAKHIISTFPDNIQKKFQIIVGETHNGSALANQVFIINKYVTSGIVVLVDGDDWLINDPDVFNIINREYHKGATVTYGSSLSLADNISLIGQSYPKEIQETKRFREYKFRWGIPFTHLRTFSKELFDTIDLNTLKNDGGFFKAGGDGALMFELFEHAPADSIRAIQDILYVYNDLNPLNDYKVNGEEQTKNANAILEKKTQREPEANMQSFLEKEQRKSEILQDVKDKDSSAIQEYKALITDRDLCWIDDTSASSIRWRIDWILNNLHESATSETSAILDVGSWTGAFSNELYREGYKNISCMEITHQVFDMGKKTFPYFNWINADIEHYTFEKKYDIILLCEVLEHVVFPEDVISRCLCALNPGGRIIYSVPSEEYVFGKDDRPSLEHITMITKEILKKYSDDIEKHIYNINPTEKFGWYIGTIQKKTKVLLAIPSAKYIESNTFLSIYNQIVPANVQLDLQCFYGYRVDQVRNLICHYGIQNNYDYIFFVDSDIILPSNALITLLNHKKPIVSGVYVQRKQGEKIPEIYIKTGNKITNASLSDVLTNMKGGRQVAGAGFGCILVQRDVLEKIGYPQFEYHPAIDHKDTLSEDVDFCIKATNAGFEIIADSLVPCEHIATTVLPCTN